MVPTPFMQQQTRLPSRCWAPWDSMHHGPRKHCKRRMEMSNELSSGSSITRMTKAFPTMSIPGQNRLGSQSRLVAVRHQQNSSSRALCATKAQASMPGKYLIDLDHLSAYELTNGQTLRRIHPKSSRPERRHTVVGVI